MFKEIETTPTLKLKQRLSDSELERVCWVYQKRIQTLTWDNPQASIVVPCHNEEYYILGMLEYMSRLQTQLPLQFIWVDNNCTDRTGEILKLCGFTCVQEKRKGTSYARQAWLEVAKSDLVFTTDADSLVPRRWIDACRNYFLQNEDLACLSGWSELYRPWIVRAFYIIDRFRYKLMQLTGAKCTQMTNFPWHNSVFRREFALKVGWYEPGSDMWEDNILARKMEKHWRILRVDNDPEVQVITSGRRMASMFLLLMTIFEKLPYAFRDKDKWLSGRTFSDVR